MKYFNHFLISALLFFALALPANASTLYLLPEAKSFDVGQEFSVDVKVETGENYINATQAVVNFPANILQLVKVDKTGSVLNFWVEEPSFSNENGTLNFIGGTPQGVSGSSLQIIKMRFKASGTGSATISVSDAVVTASDGKGTNVLTDMTGTTIGVGVVPSSLGIRLFPETVKQPEKVVRVPVVAKTLPPKPEISVPSYPDQTFWYDRPNEAVAFWSVPDDVTAISIKFDQSPNTSSIIAENELFSGKSFGVLSDGIWYIHVRFKNSVGWGAPAHYRIAIDTEPPLSFHVEKIKGAPDDPSPFISFKTSDTHAGLKEYQIRVDDGSLLKIQADGFNGNFQIPLLVPGKHLVLVRAVDKATNSVESSISFDVAPIASPTMNLLMREIFTGEGNLAFGGTALANTVVVLSVKNENGEVALSSEVAVESNGNWGKLFDQTLKKGKYYTEVFAKDGRGALSLPVKSEIFKVRERPILVLGGFEIIQFWFFAGIIAIILSAFATGWFSYRLWRERVGRKVVIAQRDVVNAFDQVKNNLDKMLKNYGDKQIDAREAVEMAFLLKKTKTDLEKTQKYIVENIKEIEN